MVESIDPFPSEQNTPIIPLHWVDQVVAKLLADGNSASHAKAVASSPVKTVNGEGPDLFGNIRVTPAQVTPAQLSSVLQQTFEGGDNIKVVVDPESGKVRINAHTIGSVWTVNGKCGHVTITKVDLGLDRVDNTSDMEKPVSNATRAALDKLLADLTARINSLKTELYAYVDGKITGIRNELNTAVNSLTSQINFLRDNKADKNHTHAAGDITGLDPYVRDRVLNRWGNWTPLPLLNGWSGPAYAITDGQQIIIRGHIMPGTSTTIGRLPYGFPVPSHAEGFGTHVVDFSDKVVGGHETRISRIQCDGGVLTINGYASMVDGLYLDGCTFWVL